MECGARKGWRKSVGSTVLEMKKYYTASRRTGVSYIQIQYKEGRIPGLVTSWVETAFINMFLKEI
jgi:hypothetical protein